MPNGPVKSNFAAYLGQLFQTTRRPNTILRLLGGIQGGIQTCTGIEFPIGVFYDLRTPAQPAVLEGAAAPTAQHRVLTQATNVVQIFHEAVTATYLGMSDGTMSGPVSIPIGGVQGNPVDPRDPAWQVMAALETIAQDLNFSLLRGTYAKPADPASTALKTRGILTAITTCVLDKSAVAVSGTDPRAQIRGFVNELMLLIIAQSGFNPDANWTLVADATTYGNIIGAYEGLDSNRTELSREVAGMKIRQIYTRYGILNLALEPDMPANTAMISNLTVAGIVGLEVPSKGILFEEALAKDGSSDKSQIYGQLGCDHGPEWCHGKLVLNAGFSI